MLFSSDKFYYVYMVFIDFVRSCYFHWCKWYFHRWKWHNTYWQAL